MSFDDAISSDRFSIYFEYLRQELNKRSFFHLSTNYSKTSTHIVKFITLLGVLSAQLKTNDKTSLIVFLDLIDLKENSHEEELRKCFLKTRGETKEQVEIARQNALQVWSLVIEKAKRIVAEIISSNNI